MEVVLCECRVTKPAYSYPDDLCHTLLGIYGLQYGAV